MTNDMTRGNPVRLILAFMIPTYLGNIFQQFYNLVDSVVAGRYIGVNALAAIGSTTSLIFLVTGWLQGITSGFSIMVAQSFGAKDYHPDAPLCGNVGVSVRGLCGGHDCGTYDF